MNLDSTLQLQTESQKSVLLDRIEMLMKDIGPVPSSFRLAVASIEKNTPYKPILTLVPFNSIDIVKLLPGDKREKKVSGKYKPGKKGIMLRESTSMRLLAEELLKHEFAHHLATTFMNTQNHDSHGCLLNTDGVYVHYELVDGLYAAMRDEYQKERDRVEESADVDIKDNPDAVFKKLFRVGTTAPSLYSLRSFDEWQAESFAMYWNGDDGRQMLRESFPATYTAVDAVLTGRVLDNETNIGE